MFANRIEKDELPTDSLLSNLDCFAEKIDVHLALSHVIWF